MGRFKAIALRGPDYPLGWTSTKGAPLPHHLEVKCLRASLLGEIATSWSRYQANVTRLFIELFGPENILQGMFYTYREDVSLDSAHRVLKEATLNLSTGQVQNQDHLRPKT